MAKTQLTGQRIQAIVSERIHSLQSVKEDGTQVRVPVPMGHAPDAQGRNWNMDWFGNATGYEASIADIVSRARDEFELVP